MRWPLSSGIWAIAGAVLLVALAATSPGLAADESVVLLTADEVIYDPERKVTQARGNVEISRGERVLLADTVTYSEPNDLVTAVGNISLTEPTGEVYFGEYMELTGDMKNGIIEDFRSIQTDGSLIAAAGGRRIGGNVTELAKAVYSPCTVCPEDPERPPLWQIKAVRVTHDADEKVVEFDHATLEFAGVPVLYTPYLSQPDPSVKRKTGFLLPDTGASSNLGLVIQAPYFWAIAPNIDLTLTPWMTSKEGPVLDTEYHHLLTNGEIFFNGSLTRDSEDRTRGAVFSKFRYDINDTWRGGLDINRASDRDYPRRYGFSKDRTLISRAFGEAFDQRNYFVANAYAFDVMNPDVNQNTTPLVAPQLDYYSDGEVDRFGGRTSVHFDTAVLSRNKGNDTRRLSGRAEWRLPMLGPLGDIYTFSAALWADGYQVEDLSRENDSSEFSGLSGRVLPQALINWKLPLIREGEEFSQEITPSVEFVAAPNYGNPSKIPNEDSQSFEFDENNVFGFSRFPGLDRVEQGSRFNYGVEWGIFGLGDATASFAIGQTYQFDSNQNVFPEGSGLQGNFSDFVSVVRISPKRYIDLLYRNRIDKSNLKARRHELGSWTGTSALNLYSSYVLFPSQEGSTAQQQGTAFPKREELFLSIGSQLTRYWHGRVFGLRDLTNGGTNRWAGVGVTYEDECFRVAIDYTRKDFDDKSVEAADEIFIRLSLKTLGDVQTGFKQQGGSVSP